MLFNQLLCQCEPCSLINLVVVEVSKLLIGRPRPHAFARRYFNVRSLVSNHAMPSGDSSEATVCALVLCGVVNSALPLLIVPCAMFARVFFGAHWLGDTVAGVATGAAVFLFCRSILGWTCHSLAMADITGSVGEFICFPQHYDMYDNSWN